MALQSWGRGQRCTSPPQLLQGARLVPEDMRRYAQQPAAAACGPSIHPSVRVPAPLARPGPQPPAAVTYPASVLGGHLSPELFHQLSLL